LPGVLGPVLVNYIREYQTKANSKAQAYSTTMHNHSGLLLIGLLCNLAVREVNSRYYNHENPPGNLAGARCGREGASLHLQLVVGLRCSGACQDDRERDETIRIACAVVSTTLAQPARLLLRHFT